MIETIKEKWFYAEEDMRCELCGCIIRKGSQCVTQTNNYDGVVSDCTMHDNCLELSQELSMYDSLEEEGLKQERFMEYVEEFAVEHTNELIQLYGNRALGADNYELVCHVSEILTVRNA